MRRRSLWLECCMRKPICMQSFYADTLLCSLSHPRSYNLYLKYLQIDMLPRHKAEWVGESFASYSTFMTVSHQLKDSCYLPLTEWPSSHLCIIWQLIVERKELNRLLLLQLCFNQFVFKCFPNWKDVSWNWLKALACFAEIIRICFFWQWPVSEKEVSAKQMADARLIGN